MIRTFNARKMLFTPVGFLNSVARWLLNVGSRSGTVRITNTANPSDDSGPSIDIDAKETAKALDGILAESYPKRDDKRLLSPSLRWEGGKLQIDKEWLKDSVYNAMAAQAEEEEEEETTDNTSASTAEDAEEDFDADFTDWTINSKKALKLRLYALVTGDAGEHTFNPIDLEFNRVGMLVAAKAVSGKSIFIGA